MNPVPVPQSSLSYQLFSRITKYVVEITVYSHRYHNDAYCEDSIARVWLEVIQLCNFHGYIALDGVVKLKTNRVPIYVLK